MMIGRPQLPVLRGRCLLDLYGLSRVIWMQPCIAFDADTSIHFCIRSCSARKLPGFISRSLLLRSTQAKTTRPGAKLEVGRLFLLVLA